MTYYAKTFNNIGALSCTYKDAQDADQTVVIAGGGAVTVIPFEVLSLPGVIRAHDAGNLKIYSDAGATTEIANFPNSPIAGTQAATTSVAGVVKKVATQADFAGADITALKAELNAWLVKLKTAGIQS